MELISMKAKVLDVEDYAIESLNFKRVWIILLNYAEFLDRKLELGMFIPCDKEGNVLKEPTSKNSIGSNHYKVRMAKYQEAKDRIIFDDVEMSNGFGTWWIVINGKATIDIKSKNKTIEDLIPYNLTLTENAINQLT